jgi:hypothetical protein
LEEAGNCTDKKKERENAVFLDELVRAGSLTVGSAVVRRVQVAHDSGKINRNWLIVLRATCLALKEAPKVMNFGEPPSGR